MTALIPWIAVMNVRTFTAARDGLPLRVWIEIPFIRMMQKVVGPKPVFNNITGLISEITGTYL